MRPIADMQYSDFLFECMDELVNQAAKLRYMSGGTVSVPLVMRAPVGATNRGAQHGQSPESYFTHVPGLKVVCVSDAYHAKGLLKSAVRDDNPVLFFEHKLLYGSARGASRQEASTSRADVPAEEYLVPLGRAVVKRAGADVTVVATHLSLYRCLAAAGELADEERDRVRGDRSADAAPARHRDDLGLVAKDRAARRSCTRTRSPAAGARRSPPGRPTSACTSSRRRSDASPSHDVPMPSPRSSSRRSSRRSSGSRPRCSSVLWVLMARPVRMPPLGTTSDELRILAWLKAEGDEPSRTASMLLEVETDKATLEVEAAVAGTLLRIVRDAGEVAGVGVVIAYVGALGDEVPAEAPEGEPTVPEAATAAPTRQGPSAKVTASPAVRRLAEQHGLDLPLVRGTGPGGRIEKQDVLRTVEGSQATGGEAVPAQRRALARRLERSAAIPQFALGVTVDMTEAAELLERERPAGVPGLGYTHLLLRAIAVALRAHPEMNALWVEDGPSRRRLVRADVGLAVAGEDSLLVVTVPEPDRLSLADLVEQSDRAAAEAREGRVSERFAAPVAVTLTNLGMVGVDRFTAIIDPDQTAIVAAGAVVERPGPVAGGVGLVRQLELTLSVDHRAVDGMAAGRFLASIRAALEGHDSPAPAP